MNNILLDQFGRGASTLRISVTDRCNLRCKYCMPEDGVKLSPHNEILSFEEIIRIVTIILPLLGDNPHIKFTGGEPLVRKNISNLISMIKNINPQLKISLTSNGILLKKFLPELIKSGLNQVNISLDTLSSDKFSTITRRNNFSYVVDSIKAALNTQLKVKINAVALKKFNDDEIFNFVKFALNNKVEIRFIEWMPFTGNEWHVPEFVSAEDLRKNIQTRYRLTLLPNDSPSQTSRVYMINGNNSARIGFIASVTESFCKNCNRIRLTADGKIRPCLHSPIEANLKTPLRSGANDDDLSLLIKQAFWQKPLEHPNFLDPDYKLPQNDREMIKIGG